MKEGTIQKAYNAWSEIYDKNLNRTRDVEAFAIREVLHGFKYKHVLEAGCGTGKNTGFLQSLTENLTSVDFSTEMMALAKSKFHDKNVAFQLLDLNDEWPFVDEQFDLISFSLVIEHIKNLSKLFEKVSKCLCPGGMVYIGELHPFKQYAGTKARFEKDGSIQELECYTHHISDFLNAAAENNLKLEFLNEYFDEDAHSDLPRVLTLLLEKAAK